MGEGRSFCVSSSTLSSSSSCQSLLGFKRILHHHHRHRSMCFSHIPLPIPLSRFKDYQPFSNLNADFFVTMEVPDGDWSLLLKAPHGSVKGAVLTSTSSSASSIPSKASVTTRTLTTFGGCKYEKDVENDTCTRVSEREEGCER